MHREDGSGERDSRVLLFSQRQLSRHAWLAGQYEFEDLLLEWEDASLVAPPPLQHQYPRSIGRRLGNAASRRTGVGQRGPLEPAPSMVRQEIRTRHDLFFAVFHQAHELSYLRRLDGWKRSSDRSACLLIELWTTRVPLEADYLQTLRQFDEVYVANPDVVPALTRLLGRAPTYLPLAVDALAAAPWRRSPARVIDVYSYGRRSPHVHHALLDLVERNGLTYVYDTLGNADFRDHREHRALMINLLQRSRYVLTHTINDSPERRSYTGGDETISPRYYEAAAAGAVLLGSRPAARLFAEAMPWPDAVVDLPYGAGDVTKVLAELDTDPDRTGRIRADNVRGVLLRHDWAHRWQQVLAAAGLAASTALVDRLGLLKRRAQDLPDIL